VDPVGGDPAIVTGCTRFRLEIEEVCVGGETVSKRGVRQPERVCVWGVRAGVSKVQVCLHLRSVCSVCERDWVGVGVRERCVCKRSVRQMQI
jgi:hypothetical protein